jgi:hypothetical protein
MAHELIGDKVVVDWKTGDPEGSRITLLSAYRDFIKEVNTVANNPFPYDTPYQHLQSIQNVFDKWKVDTENQIDDVPRIWIQRPE